MIIYCQGSDQHFPTLLNLPNSFKFHERRFSSKIGRNFDGIAGIPENSKLPEVGVLRRNFLSNKFQENSRDVANIGWNKRIGGLALK